MSWAERTRRIAMASTLLAGAAIACAPDNQPSSGPPPVRNGEKPTLPTPNSKTTLQPAPEPLPKLEPLPGSSWTIKEPKNTFTHNSTSSLLLGDQIIIQDPAGKITLVNKNLDTLWRSQENGVPAARDPGNFIALMDADNLFHLFDIKNRKDIAIIPPEYPVSKDQLPSVFNTAPLFVENMVVVPYSSASAETPPGIVVYDKNTGRRIWGTKEKQGPFILLEVKESAIVAGSDQQIFAFDIKTGETILKTEATPKPEVPNQWIYATEGENLVTLVQDGRPFGISYQGREPSRLGVVTIYNLKTKEKVFQGEIRPGIFDRDPDLKDPACVRYCTPTLTDISLYRTYNVLLKKPILAIGVEGYLNSNSPPYVHYSLTYAESSLQVSSRKTSQFFISPTRTVGGADGYMTFVSSDGEAVSFQSNNSNPGYGSGKGRDLTIGYAKVINEKTFPEVYLRNYVTDALNYIGGDATTYTFTNWPKGDEVKPPPSLIFYGFNPSKDDKNPVWIQNLGPTPQAKILSDSQNTWVISTSLQKLNLITGEITPPLAPINFQVKKAEISQGVLWLTSSDGKIATYILN